MSAHHEVNTGEARRSALDGLRPDNPYSIEEWADEFRILPPGSAEPGRYRTSRAPYLREIYECLSTNSDISEVVAMKGAQLGFTEAGNNVVGAWIDCAPGNIMIVHPTVDTAKDFTQMRIDPMINHCPRLQAKIAPPRSRTGTNTTKTKDFPGGHLTITGANSASSLSSKPISKLILDEVDRYPSDVDGQGDPVKLAMQRLATYARKKIFMISTPTIRGASRIEKAIANTDARRYFMPCPHCAEKITFEWAQMKWDEGNPDSVRMACKHCGALIDESKKGEMLSRGEWMPTKTAINANSRGYIISSLYSPVGWESWAHIVREYEEAKHRQARGDHHAMKAFVNLKLGEVFDDAVSAQSIDALRAKRESWKLGTVPDGVVILTAGVDVQGNRLEAMVVGWAPGEESWIIDYQVFWGDPAESKVWKELDEFLIAKRPGVTGGQYGILACAVDSGYLANEVYNFVRVRRSRNIIATKGSSQSGKPIISRPSKVDINRAGMVMRGGAQVFTVGTDTGKTLIYSRLAVKHVGAGYIHFPENLDDEIIAQLISERLVTRWVRGFERREWVKDPTTRNEALDCFNYALAAAHLMGIYRWGPVQWQKHSVQKIEMRDLFDGGAAQNDASNGADEITPTHHQTPVSRAPSIAPRRPIHRTGSWV